MTQDVIPCSRYQDMIPNPEIVNKIRSECIDDPYEVSPDSHIFSVSHNLDKLNHSYIAPGRDSEGLLLDIVHFGWNRSLRILNHVIGFSQRLAHKAKHPEKIFSCTMCSMDRVSADFRDNIQSSRDYLFRYESRVIQKSYNKKQLNKYFLKDGIYYHQGRFTAYNPFRFKDLDQVPLIDAHIITGPTPVVLCDSHILYSMIINIHCKLVPHAGIEMTVKEVLKEIMVHEGLRRVVKRIKKDCTLCRILEKKTMEVEMASHPRAHTIIAPPKLYCCFGLV